MAYQVFPLRRRSHRLYRSDREERTAGSEENKSIFACVEVHPTFSSSSSSSSSSSPNTTRQRPAPRSGHRIAADEANLYSFGGYNPNASQPRPGLYRELWRFNFATRRWILLKDGDECPEETASHSMLLLGTSLLVAFGTGFPFGERCSNSMHIYHIPHRTWQTAQCGGEAPSPRYGQSMTYKDGSIFVMGGTTGFSYNMKVFRLNLETLHWEDTSPPTNTFPGEDGDDTPPPRYRHEVATSGNWLYVLGGGTAQHVFNFETVPAYNTQTKKWANMTAKGCLRGGGVAGGVGEVGGSFPPPRKFHAAVQQGGYAFLCGGFDGDSVMFDDVWRLSLSDLQWTKMPTKLPRKIYFHTATTTPAGCMYVFGGVTTVDGTVRSDQVFKMWLTVPSLQELVWDRLTTQHTKLLHSLETPEKRSLLRADGITLPRKFYSRLD